MRGQPIALAVLLTGMLLASSGGQGADNDEPLPQYPKAGAYIPGPFHVLNLTGERKNRFHCLVCRNSTLPVIGLFVRLRDEKGDQDEGLKKLEMGQPLANLLQKVDQVLQKNPDGNMAGFVVFFGEPEDETPIASRLHGVPEAKIESLLKQANIKYLTFAFDTNRNSGKYFADLVPAGAAEKDKGLPAKEMIRVMMYHNYRLVYDVRTFDKEKPLTDKDVDAILADLNKMTPPPVVNRKKPKTQVP
jgi:hypothetical protein